MSDTAAAPIQRRRIWPWVLGASALVLAGLVLTILFFATDPQRVVRYLGGILERDYGVRLTLEQEPELTWLGEVGLRVRGFRLDVIETGQPLMWGESLAVALPWRALFSDTLEIREVRFVQPVFHAAGLAHLRMPAADPGAGAPLRWPRITSGVELANARWIGAGEPVVTYGGIDLSLAPLQSEQPLLLSGSIAPGEQPWTFRLSGTPRDTENGLALDELTLELAGPAEATLQGAAAFDDAREWHVQGTLLVKELPAELAAMLQSDAGRGAELEVAATRSGEEPVQLGVQGRVGERTLDASLAVTAPPDLSQPLPAVLNTLAQQLRGHAAIEQLQIGPATLRGVRIEGDTGAEAATDTRAAAATEQRSP